MKFIFSIASLIISGILLFTIAKPLYQEVSVIKTQIKGYEVALENFNNLIKKRDALIESYRNISDEDKNRVEKFLPKVTSNLRFILEIEKIANNYKLPLTDIKFTEPSPQDSSATVKTSVSNPTSTIEDSKPYAIFPVEFTLESKYDTFAEFLYEIEHNLRLVDINSISFEASSAVDEKTGLKNDINVFKFKIKIETYGIK